MERALNNSWFLVLVTTFSFLSALYPYPITTDILLDGKLLGTIDLRDYDSLLNDTGPATVPTQIVFSHMVTEEREYNVRIAVPGNDSAGVAVVDVLMYVSSSPRFLSLKKLN